VVLIVVLLIVVLLIVVLNAKPLKERDINSISAEKRDASYRAVLHVCHGREQTTRVCIGR
jgi:hypothetical protein